MNWDPIEEQFKWAGKYPYSVIGKKLFKELGISIDELLEDKSPILNVAYREIASLLDDDIIVPETNEYVSLVKFYISSMIVYALGNTFLINRFIEREASRAIDFLKRASNDEIKRLSSDLGIDIAVDNDQYLIHFTDFVELIKGLSHIHWKLYYFELEKGYVKLTKRNMLRLLKEAIKEEIENIIFNIEAIPDAIAELANKIRIDYKEKLFIPRKGQDKVGSKNPDEFPPCMLYLYNNIDKGLPHPGRFTIVAFLSNVGYSVEEILDLFRVTPDFNEKITRYQIEHILGLRGGKIKYSTPSCRKIKSFGFCFPDKICKQFRVRHPFQYLKGRRRATK